jgi:hypothetical protein
MKRSKFTTREGLVMLLGVALVLIVMLWLRRIRIDFAFSAEASPGVLVSRARLNLYRIFMPSPVLL